LVGGRGSLATPKPVQTVGSYWPYATTLFDYIRRTMPYDAPQSLGPDETYTLSAYILSRNGLLPDDAVLDAGTLAGVRMPNRDGFTADARPDVPAAGR
ncbi:cytochrome c, partial [Methylobacterium sp. WL69]